MFRNRMAQEIRRQAFQCAVDGWRAQQAAAVGIGGSSLGALTGKYYSVGRTAKDNAWEQQPKLARTAKDGREYGSQYFYAKAMIGRDPVGLRFDDIVGLFGSFHVLLMDDSDGSWVHYVGNSTHTGGKGHYVGIAPRFFADGFRLATPDGTVNVDKYIYTVGLGEGRDPAYVARAIADLAAKSTADRALPQGVGWDSCNPYGELTKTQAQVLDSIGQCTGCCVEIKNLKAPVQACPAGYTRGAICQVGISTESAPGRPECVRCSCPPGFMRVPSSAGVSGMAFGAVSSGALSSGSLCKAGETIEYADGNKCYRCNAPVEPPPTHAPICSPGYAAHDKSPSCSESTARTGNLYRPERDPNVAGCWRCVPACPTGFQVQAPTCPTGQVSKQDPATSCWGPCVPACPTGYYVLPAGAPFTCPPWQTRKVDEASGCVACETAANCFLTASGLACSAGKTPQNYGEYTCCAASPATLPPSAAPPSTDPAISPEKPNGTKTTEEAGGVAKAGIGVGGGLALAGVAIAVIYALVSKSGSAAGSATSGSGPRGGGGPDAERPRGLSGMRGRLPR